MRFLSLMLACLLFVGCHGCAGLKYKHANWDPMGDSDAAYAQKLMRQTTEIFVKGTTLVPDLESKKPALKTARFGAQGSGTVIAKRGKGKTAETLILTADHLCQVAKKETVEVPISKEISVTAPVLGMEISVYSIDMDKMEAEIIHQDPENDLCVMKVAGDAGEVTAIAKDAPPIGAFTQIVGAPKDNYSYHMAMVFDGRYCGTQPVLKEGIWLETYSAFSAGGSSGGGIYYHGKLVSTLVRADPYYGHPVYGVPLPKVQAEIAAGKRAWLGQPSTKTSGGK